MTIDPAEVRPPTSILITGSRLWNDYATMWRVLGALGPPGATLVHGDAPGADRMAARIWGGWGRPVHPVPAPWDQLGKAAGPARNKTMVALGGYAICVAFPLPTPGRVSGTEGCMELAREAGIPVLTCTGRKGAGEAAGHGDDDVISARNPDPDDLDSYCDDCGARPGNPCERSCNCLPCMVGTVPRKET